MVTTIPSGKITKVAIHVNTARQSMSQIQKSLGCQYILNGGLFNMSTLQPINQLVVDGKTLSKNGNPYGYAIDGTKLTFSYENNVNASSFLGAYPVLVRDGRALNEKVPNGLGGYTHRSCIGVTKFGDIVLLCDITNRSLSGVTAELVKAGCDTAINLDGGGSSQCIFGDKILLSTRVVHNYICVWTSPVTQSLSSTTSDDSAAATAWVRSMGISDGTNPIQSATRQQVWQMLYRLKDKL